MKMIVETGGWESETQGIYLSGKSKQKVFCCDGSDSICELISRDIRARPEREFCSSLRLLFSAFDEIVGGNCERITSISFHYERLVVTDVSSVNIERQ